MAGSLGDAVGGAIFALHRRLLPATTRVGLMPYLWLFWLIGFFLKWFFVPLEPVEFTLALLTMPVFLVLYFNGYRGSGQRILLSIVGILLIAIVWTPVNVGATSFFVYAAAFVGRAARPPRAYLWLAGIVLLVVVEWLVFDLVNLVPWFGGALSLLVGSAGIHSGELERQDAVLKLSQAEVRRLAVVAERERIARDLHDLLGHTLSLITIKAELAAKLMARGDHRAEQEIRDVENISRDALREVREAVVGFRRADLDSELASARLACAARGIELTVDRPNLDLSSHCGEVLAMCLREAITNVVRHSAARRCRASLVREGRWIRLAVEDDGRGGTIRAGAGLAGLRERVEWAGGRVTVTAARGVTLTVRIPADPKHPTAGLPTTREANA
ncbi:MAG: sensor histidine kinase [Acidobacteria bacterium]|nr:sensor histidine kinase [Acidobacteriota bacterium]